MLSRQTVIGILFWIGLMNFVNAIPVNGGKDIYNGKAQYPEDKRGGGPKPMQRIVTASSNRIYADADATSKVNAHRTVANSKPMLVDKPKSDSKQLPRSDSLFEFYKTKKCIPKSSQDKRGHIYLGGKHGYAIICKYDDSEVGVDNVITYKAAKKGKDPKDIRVEIVNGIDRGIVFNEHFILDILKQKYSESNLLPLDYKYYDANYVGTDQCVIRDDESSFKCRALVFDPPKEPAPMKELSWFDRLGLFMEGLQLIHRAKVSHNNICRAILDSHGRISYFGLATKKNDNPKNEEAAISIYLLQTMPVGNLPSMSANALNSGVRSYRDDLVAFLFSVALPFRTFPYTGFNVNDVNIARRDLTLKRTFENTPSALANYIREQRRDLTKELTLLENYVINLERWKHYQKRGNTYGQMIETPR